MGNAGGDGAGFTLAAESAVDGAKVRNEVSQLLGKAGTGDNGDG